MELDVDTPDPPDLTNRGLPSEIDPEIADGRSTDLRRSELESVLRAGAWSEAFDEWAAYTDLTAEAFETIRDRGLLQDLDFYWDPTDDRVQFEVPTTPPEWDDNDDLATAEAELTGLADVVVEMIEDAYGDWEGDGMDQWTEEAFDEEPTGEGPPR